MRALVQRAAAGSVDVAGERIGEIGKGLVILLGVTHSDTEKDAAFLAEKCMNLRIFEDDAGKMNRSLLDVGGEALIISQFTLYGDASHGRRPSFTEAARPEVAIPLYEKFVELCRGYGVRVATGRFGAEMLVSIRNDGPVTILAESR
ncbi:D-tyrosyl-tRNA(Tyr) deacylase [Victivallaceae bacterium BBE-744-WT-12]|uniref:D-aminoacyl-tRNA deacylase n=1 Tax=Victivallis lenta TaxID=2606640 RepID=A0A844G2E8_9BACT|nr:D-aminoacyl-tRNA deacylase [Victivallis lenta]AVM43900.1 D-tyrosyl-tRNA(Tyr) deacylase [Victivallales bacterium CCUG 44730]MBS1453369.1 D-tyrosyl-tRNA(Tyr) deacylase [Lentisphaeria bacterium]MBS5530783.1 D-tyrosyl-tRNA(Tyr) deacylase [bacterium]MST96728.1 D-tyrosyl-tRNA(Tyr) deacylase [Victivallis lenta]HBP07161.1 D-tyrosyl-tRNA(Tyr) deacylase [Lentisphaeria bacterium]